MDDGSAGVSGLVSSRNPRRWTSVEARMKRLAVSFVVVAVAYTTFVAVAVVALELTDTMPWWTERRPWEAVEIDEDRIMIDFRLAGDCEKPDVPTVTETEGEAHISGHVKVDLSWSAGSARHSLPGPRPSR